MISIFIIINMKTLIPLMMDFFYAPYDDFYSPLLIEISLFSFQTTYQKTLNHN
jgi:hypothetical protein